MKINHAALSSRHQVIVHCLGSDDSLPTSLPAPLREHVADTIGKQNVLLVPTLGHLPQPWLLIVRIPAEAVGIRRRGGAVAKAVVAQGIERIFISALPSLSLPPGQALELFLLGFNQGAYSFTRYKNTKSAPTIALSCADKLPAALRTRLQGDSALVSSCRDLINTPAMDCGPADFVREARKLARGSGVKLTVFNQAELLKKAAIVF